MLPVKSGENFGYIIIYVSWINISLPALWQTITFPVLAPCSCLALWLHPDGRHLFTGLFNLLCFSHPVPDCLFPLSQRHCSVYSCVPEPAWLLTLWPSLNPCSLCKCLVIFLTEILQICILNGLHLYSVFQFYLHSEHLYPASHSPLQTHSHTDGRAAMQLTWHSGGNLGFSVCQETLQWNCDTDILYSCDVPLSWVNHYYKIIIIGRSLLFTEVILVRLHYYR